MEKDEILAKAKEENKNKDLAEIDVERKASVVAVIAGAVIALIFSIISIVLGYRFNAGFLAIVFGMEAALFWYKWAVLRKKHELSISICYTIATLCAAAAFIIALISESPIL